MRVVMKGKSKAERMCLIMRDNQLRLNEDFVENFEIGYF
jgi:hypothetical protein